MVTFAKRMRNFFHPIVDIPDEDDSHKEAVEKRAEEVRALRAQLKTDPSIHAKIDDITALLAGLDHTNER